MDDDDDLGSRLLLFPYAAGPSRAWKLFTVCNCFVVAAATAELVVLAVTEFNDVVASSCWIRFDTFFLCRSKNGYSRPTNTWSTWVRLIRTPVIKTVKGLNTSKLPADHLAAIRVCFHWASVIAATHNKLWSKQPNENPLTWVLLYLCCEPQLLSIVVITNEFGSLTIL